jgi:hypothetical protein
MLDPVTNQKKPLKFFKHMYLLDIFGFAGYIFFPWLHADQRESPNFNNYILDDEFYLFIETVLLPCLRVVQKDGTFPDNVRCKNQYKGINRNKFNSLQFPVGSFSRVVQEIRDTLSLEGDPRLRCFRDFFFHFQSIGIKNIYKGTKDQTIGKLIKFLETFVDVDCSVKSYYDVGVEFYYEKGNENHTVFWSKNGAEALFWGLDRRGNVTRSSNMYSPELLGTIYFIIFKVW